MTQRRKNGGSSDHPESSDQNLDFSSLDFSLMPSSVIILLRKLTIQELREKLELGNTKVTSEQIDALEAEFRSEEAHLQPA